MLFLSDKLPQPNYERPNKRNNSFTKKNTNELPDIRSINNRKKPKRKESNGDLIDASLIDTRMNPQIASIKKKSSNRDSVN